VQLNYLQTLVNLPWGEYTHDDLNLKRAQKILDKDHYGMEKAKERILEYIARRIVVKRRPEVTYTLSVWSSGSRKDIVGQEHRRGYEA